jgi:hypothetical protein
VQLEYEHALIVNTGLPCDQVRTINHAARPSYAGAKRGLAYNEPSLCKPFGDQYGFGYN